MGNTGSTTAGASRVSIGLGNLLTDVDPELQYDKSMGTSRFLKAIRARHRYGLVLVKAYIKPEAALSLEGLVRRLRVEREALADVPHVLAYQRFVETATVGYLVRQWLASNLYDRISTRPFLTNIEKKWITYQLLHAMRDARLRNIPHGDLKCENILVTSSLSVYITDFAASFKPAYLPLNDPADFNFFFGTSGRRTCYVAPERFYGSASELKLHAQDTAKSSRGADPAVELGHRNIGHVTEAMDVFSLGCVIAELWRDGAPIFTLTQLFKYREGNFDVEPALAEVGDDATSDMVRTMISLKPDDRLTFDAHLSRGRGKAFPESFYSFIHRYLVDLQRVAPQHAAALASSSAGGSWAATTVQGSSAFTAAGAPSDAGAASTLGATRPSTVRDEADDRIERLYEEWSVIVRFLGENSKRTQGTFGNDEVNVNMALQDGSADLASAASDKEAAERVLPVLLCIPGLTSQVISRSKSDIDEDGPALLMLSPILASLRGALRPSTKVHALDLLLHLASRWLTDETILDRVLPYTVALLDDVPVVRTAAIRACTQLLMLVETLTPANAIVFQEYIVPHLRRLTMDPSPEVRAMFAECVVELCRVGDRFLQLAQSMRAAGMFALEGGAPGNEVDGGAGTAESEDFLDPTADDEASYDVQLAALRAFFQEQVTTLLTDPSSTVKRALLANIAPLCSFFGSAPTNDVLLSHMITYLNDRSWLLRHAFFSAIVGVAGVAGQRSVEQYILPLMLQALSDPEESVVLRVLEGLSELMDGQHMTLMSRAKMLDVVGATAGFLCHPNHWLRLNAANLCSLASRYLSHSDVWALVYPSLRPLLRSEVRQFDELQLISMAKEPLSRPVLQAAVLWAARVNKTSFWKPPPDAKKNAGLCNGIGREGLSLLAGRSGQAIARTPVPRTEEDDGFLDKLRALGLGPDDEVKLVALRDYIWKLARQVNTSRIASANSGNVATSQTQQVGVDIQPLDGVTPLTIFFTTNARSAVSGSASGGHSYTPDSVRSSIRSSFSNNVARRRLTGSRVPSEVASLSPLAELSRRMDPNPSSQLTIPAAPEPLGPPVHSPLRPLSSPPRSISGAQGRLGRGKAAPAIAATSANATGTMSDLAARLRSLDPTHEASGNATPANSADQTTIQGGTVQDRGVETTYAANFSSNYAGDDLYVKAHLEAVYMATFRDRPSTWGPHVASGGTASHRKGMRIVSSSARTVASGSSNRRPEGNLVACFTEHSSPITALAVSPDHIFFASGSEDGSVKVWDTARLEKNVTSRSRATYAGQKGGITALITLEGTHCVASAAVDGSIHVLRIDVAVASSLPRYGKLRLVSNFQLSSPGEHALCLLQSSTSAGGLFSTAAATSVDMSSTSLILGTSRSRITVLDLRTMQVLQTLRNPPHFGPITCMCTDKKNVWLLVGTLGGVMALWDLRFSLLLKSWRVGSDAKAEFPPLQGIVRVTRVTPHPSKGKGRQVLIAYERKGASQVPDAHARALYSDKHTETLVEVWDIDKGVQVESFQTDAAASSSSMIGASTSRRVASNSIIAPSIKRKDPSFPAHDQDHCEAPSSETAPTQDADAAGSQTEGLSGAADAIARLVRLHEASETEQHGERMSKIERTSDDEEVVATATSMHAQLQPPRSMTAGVKAMLVGNEGYSSSSVAAAGQVSGGWLDAGKLAAEGDTTTEGTGTTGPAGWMITAGEDRCIRFWDMGRTERSVCFGTVDQRSEFKFQPQSSAQSSAHHVHHLSSSFTSASSTARAQLRSPLLTQQQTGQAQALMRAHKDAISALAVLSQPFRCVVAGDAQGAIRVWE